MASGYLYPPGRRRCQLAAPCEIVSKRLAVDGTRLKAVNSTDRNFTREKLVKMIRSADKRLADYLSRPDRTDADEDGASGRPAKNLTEKIAALKDRKMRHEGMLKELERDGLVPEGRRGLQRPGRV